VKNVVFCDVTPCDSCKNRISEELSDSIMRVTRMGELGTTLAVTSNRHSVFLRSMRRLLFTANVAPFSPTLVTLMMEKLSSPKRRFLQEPHGITSQKTVFMKKIWFSASGLR
jgi:hypothetical protein